jgi:hypothetical protein
MSPKPHLRIACVDFWASFEPADIGKRHPVLAELAEIEWCDDPSRADLTIFSCFPNGIKNPRYRDPRSWTKCPGPRLFYCAENIPADFTKADFAITFSRTLLDGRHLRLPNYLARMPLFGFSADALLKAPADPARLLAQKTRFCMYIQGNRVPFRERFVLALSRYKPVDCAGPSLNNTGFLAGRMQKFDLYRESKFAVTFENEAALGYTTEKLTEAFLADTLPIYWGDPAVGLDFNLGAMVRVANAADVEAAIERIIALDRDDAAYVAALGARRYACEGYPISNDPQRIRAFFEKVLLSAVPEQKLQLSLV